MQEPFFPRFILGFINTKSNSAQAHPTGLLFALFSGNRRFKDRLGKRPGSTPSSQTPPCRPPGRNRNRTPTTTTTTVSLSVRSRDNPSASPPATLPRVPGRETPTAPGTHITLHPVGGGGGNKAAIPSLPHRLLPSADRAISIRVSFAFFPKRFMVAAFSLLLARRRGKGGGCRGGRKNASRERMGEEGVSQGLSGRPIHAHCPQRRSTEKGGTGRGRGNRGGPPPTGRGGSGSPPVGRPRAATAPGRGWEKSLPR